MFYLPVFILILPACKFTQLTQFVGWLIYMSVVGILGIVRMLVCAGACVCVLRIVSMDKTLPFKKTFIIIIIME